MYNGKKFDLKKMIDLIKVRYVTACYCIACNRFHEVEKRIRWINRKRFASAGWIKYQEWNKYGIFNNMGGVRSIVSLACTSNPLKYRRTKYKFYIRAIFIRLTEKFDVCLKKERRKVRKYLLKYFSLKRKTFITIHTSKHNLKNADRFTRNDVILNYE